MMKYGINEKLMEIKNCVTLTTVVCVLTNSFVSTSEVVQLMSQFQFGVSFLSG